MELKGGLGFHREPREATRRRSALPLSPFKSQGPIQPDLIQRAAEEGSLDAGGREGISGVCPLPEPKVCVVGPILGLRFSLFVWIFFFFSIL